MIAAKCGASARPRRRITDAQIEAALRRERESRPDPMRRHDRRVKVRNNFLHMPGAVPQTACSTAGFLRCCEKFYARIDRDIRAWDFEQNLKLGVRQFVLCARRERNRTKAMRRLVRDDLVRRGAV